MTELATGKAPKRTAIGHKYYPVPSLQTLREKRGLSRRELAERAGTTRVTLFHIETGKHLAASHTIFRLAEALGVTPMDVVLPPPEEGESEEET